MYGANRLGDNVRSICRKIPSGPFYRGSSDVLVDNRPAIRLGDPAVPGNAITGSRTVFINNRPAVRQVDQVVCGKISQSSSSTFYG